MKSKLNLIHMNEKIKVSSKRMIIFVYMHKLEGEITVYHYQRLRDLREDKDMNQSDVAKLIDTTPQQYSLYERGIREIPFHHVITLAKFYRTSCDYIAGLTNKK